ncbi:MAG: nicotinate-nucleotide diphosphorylase (carboxylating) [Lentisphaerae bacterium GWF2_45_14]|nr:MAG: nicotinate-nucleotide diphosphorylase (carboxylating) [Lentisphaerae bacterium GWF2_45_14]
MALEEDLDGSCDATTVSVIAPELQANAVLICKEDCVCAGLEVAGMVFKKLFSAIQWRPLVNDGDFCPCKTILAEIKGPAHALLTGERTALNFIQRLCGVATVSKRYADAVSGSETVILDTRKTTPGWRNLEKYAVAVGGSSNHRIGLFDRIMIKDNHRELAGMEGPGGITRSVKKAHERFPELEVEVEADTLDELREAIEAGADYVLLDNMTNEQMAEAVKINSGRARLEASGGITLERIPSIAVLGVDFISSGALTHSVKSTDISMEISTL